MSKNNKPIAYLFLLLAPSMVGINIVGSKYLIVTVPILFLLAIRFFLATILLLPLHWLTPDARNNSLCYYLRQLNRKDWLFLIAQALGAGVLFNFLMVLGLQYTDANVAGIITSALPAIIVVLSCLVLKETFTLKKGLCVALATLGLIVINTGNLFGKHLQSTLWGNLIIFISLLPEASYYILTKLHPSRLPLFLMSSLVNAINAIILLPLLVYYLNWHSLQLPLFNWFVLFLVGTSSGLFYVFWYIGSAKVDAVMAALSTAIMPIATVTIAWLTLGETVAVSQGIGIVLVIASILAYALPSRG